MFLHFPSLFVVLFNLSTRRRGLKKKKKKLTSGRHWIYLSVWHCTLFDFQIDNLKINLTHVCLIMRKNTCHATILIAVFGEIMIICKARITFRPPRLSVGQRFRYHRSATADSNTKKTRLWWMQIFIIVLNWKNFMFSILLHFFILHSIELIKFGLLCCYDEKLYPYGLAYGCRTHVVLIFWFFDWYTEITLKSRTRYRRLEFFLLKKTIRKEHISKYFQSKI